MEQLGEEMVRALCQSLLTAEWVEQAHCFKHSKACPWKPSLRPGELWCEIAGTTCVAWSSMRSGSSAHRKWMHSSTLPCLAWLHFLKTQQPHIWLHECVHGFESGIFNAHLQDTYSIWSHVFCPSQLGVPATRHLSVARIDVSLVAVALKSILSGCCPKGIRRVGTTKL